MIAFKMDVLWRSLPNEVCHNTRFAEIVRSQMYRWCLPKFIVPYRKKHVIWSRTVDELK